MGGLLGGKMTQLFCWWIVHGFAIEWVVTKGSLGVRRWIVIEYDEFRLFNHLELNFLAASSKVFLFFILPKKIGKIAKDAFHTHRHSTMPIYTLIQWWNQISFIRKSNFPSFIFTMLGDGCIMLHSSYFSSTSTHSLCSS